VGRGGRGRIRRLSVATAVSNSGNWAAAIALSLAIFTKTGSTVWLAASFLFTQVPAALLAPVGGMIADRFDRRRVMIVCDLLGAVTYAGMASVRAPSLLIVLGSLAALLHMPFGPASSAAVPNLIGEQDLSWANGTLAAASRVGTLVGPAIGGTMFGFFGAGAAFWVNAVSFAISAAVIARIPGRFGSRKPAVAEEADGGVWAGLQYILREPVLLVLTAVGAISFVGSEVSTVAELPMIHRFGVGGVGYGIMNTMWGAGGLLGALTAARIVNKSREPKAAVYGVLFFGIFLGAIGLSPVFWLIPLFVFLFAFSDPFSYVGFGGIYQRGTPDEIRGRVFAVVEGIMTLSMALAFGIGGFLVEATGWRPVFYVGGLVVVGSAIVLGFALRGGIAPAGNGRAKVAVSRSDRDL
jgi:MFS family permease